LKLLIFSDSILFSDSSNTDCDSLGCSDTMVGMTSCFLELSFYMF
jgi:hypothetical protein